MTLRYHYFNYIIIHERILSQGSDSYLLLLTLTSAFLGQIPKGPFSLGTFTNLHFTFPKMDWSPSLQVLLPLPTTPIDAWDRFILSVFRWTKDRVMEWAEEGWLWNQKSQFAILERQNSTWWLSYVLEPKASIQMPASPLISWWPQTSYLTSLCLSCLTCGKGRVIIASPQRAVVVINWANTA